MRVSSRRFWDERFNASECRMVDRGLTRPSALGGTRAATASSVTPAASASDHCTSRAKTHSASKPLLAQGTHATPRASGPSRTPPPVWHNGCSASSRQSDSGQRSTHINRIGTKERVIAFSSLSECRITHASNGLKASHRSRHAFTTRSAPVYGAWSTGGTAGARSWEPCLSSGEKCACLPDCDKPGVDMPNAVSVPGGDPAGGSPGGLDAAAAAVE